MTAREEVGRILTAESDTARKHLYFAALLSRELKDTDALPAIVVGGSAVEIYLDGVYVSGDIDIVTNRKAAARVLESWGFRQDGREWYSHEWKIAADLVRDPEGYTGAQRLTRTVVTPYGPVRLVGLEDLIVKRLASAKFGGNHTERNQPSDRDQAALLYRKNRPSLDRAYLTAMARIQQVDDEFAALEQEIAT
jgi:hypothetical protein